VTQKETAPSVHLSDFPVVDNRLIDKLLEERMQLAQTISSMVLSLRKRSNIRVRQPLSKIIIPLDDNALKNQIKQVEDLIQNEVNIKNIVFIDENDKMLVKNVKPNFKSLGPRYGKMMKQIADVITGLPTEMINRFEKERSLTIKVQGIDVILGNNDIEVFTEDIPGWVVQSEGKLTIALDITLDDNLINEGLARDFINKVQNLRKEKQYEVTDRIAIKVEKNDMLNEAIQSKYSYICSETLADQLSIVEKNAMTEADLLVLNDELSVNVEIKRIKK
jgi:isoleucyl-tRNA synthetase